MIAIYSRRELCSKVAYSGTAVVYQGNSTASNTEPVGDSTTWDVSGLVVVVHTLTATLTRLVLWHTLYLHKFDGLVWVGGVYPNGERGDVLDFTSRTAAVRWLKQQPVPQDVLRCVRGIDKQHQKSA